MFQFIFLHAFPLDSRMWDEQLSILPKTPVRPNLYKLGDSLEAWASAILDSAADKPLFVVGASMGASCALEMARQESDRIAALVLVGAKAGHHPEPHLRDRYISSLSDGGIMELWSDIGNQCIGGQCDPKITDRIKTMAKDQPTEDLIQAMKVFHSRPDLTRVVSQWRKPLLVVCGTNGTIESKAKGASIADLAVDSKLHVMEGCGHYMNIERPNEFNEVLGNFIDYSHKKYSQSCRPPKCLIADDRR